MHIPRIGRTKFTKQYLFFPSKYCVHYLILPSLGPRALKWHTQKKLNFGCLQKVMTQLIAQRHRGSQSTKTFAERQSKLVCYVICVFFFENAEKDGKGHEEKCSCAARISTSHSTRFPRTCIQNCLGSKLSKLQIASPRPILYPVCEEKRIK
jgi:hypothetical protein